jgi:AAA+ ATPase superfamily predicted ATPase
LEETFDIDSMIDLICQQDSLFLNEGKNRLIEEFGKEYATYFSILSLIADSKTSRTQIESILEKNISGHLARLENDYNIIKSIKPIGAKPNSKVQKYEIIDNFLAFWFRFIYKYQSFVEANNFEALKGIIKRDLDTFKGKFLEKLFVDLFKEQHLFTKIGSYWDRKSENEIDIVGIDELSKSITFCEVKLNKRKLDETKLILKSKKLVEKYSNYRVYYKLLSLDDLE